MAQRHRYGYSLQITSVCRIYNAESPHYPGGAVVLIRDYSHPDRQHYATQIARLCRQQRIPFLVAGDAGLARRIGAAGVHLPEYAVHTLPGLRRRYPRWLFTVAVHSFPALQQAERQGAHAVLLSPFFATVSHPDARPLAAMWRNRLVHRARLPVIALGGITRRRARGLRPLPLAGIAGIGLWHWPAAGECVIWATTDKKARVIRRR